MGKLLDGFCKLIEADEDVTSIAELMNDKEIQQWELLVKAFRDINVTTIGKDLKKVSSFYKLERWQEMAILALVKHFELMIKTASDEEEKFLQLKQSMDKLDGIDADISTKSYDGMFS